MRDELAGDEALWIPVERLRVEGASGTSLLRLDKFFYWVFEDDVRSGHATPQTSYADLFDGWLKHKQEAAEYWIVRELKPPVGETWKVVGEAHYFSLYARGRQSFYAVRRNRIVSKSRPGTLREASGPLLRRLWRPVWGTSILNLWMVADRS